MSKLRLAVIAVLGLVTVSVHDSCREAHAQSAKVTQTVGPNGSINTTAEGNDGTTTQIITPDGKVLTRTVLPDGTVITQNITADGAVLSDDGLTAERSAKNRPLSPKTLRSGLDVCIWDAGQRGPLLAVAPETVLPVWQKVVRKPLETFAPPQFPEPLPGGRYRVGDLAEYFGYRIVRLPGLSVLAPKEMVTFNSKPGKPNYFADLTQEEKLQMLQASLSEAQWKLLGGEDGLGASDLSGKQRELFIACLPNPLVIVKPQVYGSDARSIGPKEKPIVLSGSQLSTVRLRLNRAVVSVAVPLPGGAKSIHMSGDSIGTDYAAINYSGFGSDGSTVFGQQIRRTVPNRLKPQQIDFAAPALRKPVSLVGVKTVGDLIELIRTTTGVEIYVDGRAAKRTLWVRSGETQTIGAGDALQALCWSLTGAVRYVSSGGKSGVFILTEDLEGIGSRLALLKDWAEAAQKQATQARIALQDKVRNRQPLQYIRFAAGDPNALGEKANKAIEDGWKMPRGRWQGASVPLADLSAQQQKSIANEIASFNASSTRRVQYDNQALASSQTVAVSVYIRPVFLVPGVGIVRDAGSFNAFVLRETLLPPAAPVGPADSASIPASLGRGDVLCVSPVTDEEARQAVRAAQERGLKQVWLVLPLVPAAANDSETPLAKSKTLLAAAADEARKTKSPIKVLAGVRLFRLPAPSESAPVQTDAPVTKELDITITGELPSEMAKRRAANPGVIPADAASAVSTLQITYDWAVPGSAGLTERIVRRLSEVAAVPGVSGLALLDASPPGYSLPSTSPDQANSFRLPRHEDFASVGYNPLARVAFIRSAGFDPVDITSDTFAGGVDLRLPFWEPGAGLSLPNVSAIKSVAEWNQFRSGLLSKALADLSVPLTASLPKSEGGFPVYLRSLDADSSTAAGWFSRWETKDALPRRGSSEQVLDFSDVPVRRALELLQGIERPSAARGH